MHDHELPLVYFHVLAKDKAKVLPYWLEQNLDNLDYPRDKIILSFRTNNNNDDTAAIIEDWIYEQPIRAAQGYESDEHLYNWRAMWFNSEDVPEQVQRFGVHEWNAERFDVLAKLRQEGIQDAKDMGAHYFVCDVDNFLLPDTLRTLVEANRPVIAPILRYAVAEGEEDHAGYSNYHHPVTATGYFQNSDKYFALLNGIVRGIKEVDLVHCTYLIDNKVLDKTNYFDGTSDYEYVRVARNWRKNNVPQYLDNRQIYGYLTLHENVDACKYWMGKLIK
jgi:hypothetical protein